MYMMAPSPSPPPAGAIQRLSVVTTPLTEILPAEKYVKVITIPGKYCVLSLSVPI